MDKAFYYAYARHILFSALSLKKDDVLAINTEEENIDFARQLAELAKEYTDNGSYLMLVDNGKKGDQTEIFSDYLINRNPTVFIYLQSYKDYKDIEDKGVLSAPEIQHYRHLASPLCLEKPNIVFATVPCPSASWGDKVSDQGGLGASEALISDLLALNEEDGVQIIKDALDLSRYDNGNLNKDNKHHCHIETYDGMTDLDFNFLPQSSFHSFEEKTVEGRSFLPSLISFSHARAVDKRSANGYVHITKPFLLFGKKIESLTLTFENGRVSSFETDEESSKLLNLFFSLDEDNSALSELIVADENNRANPLEYFAYPEWDRMRTTHITLGQAHEVSIEYETEADAEREGAALSLSYLCLPIGCEEMSITLSDEKGNERMILEDGMIKEDFDE